LSLTLLILFLALNPTQISARFAQNIEIISEADVYPVILSNNSVNRLVFSFRLRSLKSAAPFIDVQFEGNTANVTIVGDNSADLVVYAATGSSYVLRLIPQDIESQTVLLSIPKRPPQKFGSSYLESIKNLVMAGYRNEVPPGYEVKELYQKVERPDQPGDLYIVKVVSGLMDLKLIEMTFVNTTDQPIKLQETTFLDDDVRAVSVDKKLLNPKDLTTIYVVK